MESNLYDKKENGVCISAASVHGNAAFFLLAKDGVAHSGMIMAC